MCVMRNNKEISSKDIKIMKKSSGYYFAEWLVEVIKLSKGDPNSNIESKLLIKHMRQLQSLYDWDFNPDEAYSVIR